MTTKTLPEVPAGMERIYRRFERWRKSHRGRLPIPAGLWAAASAVAREHGVFRTAKILRLEHGKLKRMVASAKPAIRLAPAPTGFLELIAPQGVTSGPGLTECLIELEGPRGKMRIQWKGATAPDLAGLSPPAVRWASSPTAPRFRGRPLPSDLKLNELSEAGPNPVT